MKRGGRFKESDLVQISKGNWRLYLHKNYQQSFILESVLGASGATPSGRISKSRHATNRKLEFELEGEKKALFVKSFFPPRPDYLIRDFFRPSKAFKAWKAASLLSANGFHTARFVLAGEKRKWGVLTESVLVTEEAPGVTILEYAAEHFGADAAHDAIRKKRALLRSLGREVGRMHYLGIIHGDLLPGNVLVENREGEIRFIFIDNDRTRKLAGDISLKLAARNLVQLGRFPLVGVTLTDRLRFFKAYLKENEKLQLKERRLLRMVVQKTRERLLKRRRRHGENAEFLSFRALLSAKDPKS